jgi:hypothetical protein
LVLFASIFGGALLLLSSNTQEGEMPLLALAGLYGAEIIRRDTAGTQEDSFLLTARNLGALALFALLLAPVFGTDCKTVLFAARNTPKSKWVSTPTLKSTRLNDFRFATSSNGTRSEEMRGYMDNLDDGIQLLRRHSDPRMRLNALVFSNPFHLALGLAPAEGGVLGLTGTAITRHSHPSLKRMVGDATHILTNRGSLGFIKDAYGEEWDALHLEVVEETKDYTLYRVPEGKDGQASHRLTKRP